MSGSLAYCEPAPTICAATAGLITVREVVERHAGVQEPGMVVGEFVAACRVP